MKTQNTVKQVGTWAGKKLASGALFVAGGALLLAGVYAFQTLTNDPTTDPATTFSSNGAPMLTRSGGTYDRESMSLEAISDYVTAMSLISPMNASVLSYSNGTNSTGTLVTWGIVPKAESYVVYVGSSQGTLAAQMPATSNLSKQLAGLTENSVYYWKVVANMPGGKTKDSPVWTFTTNCGPTKTLDGGSSCIATKNIGTCTIAAGHQFYNNSNSYTINATWNGSTWNPSTFTPGNTYTTTALTVNTCQYNCATGYGWNGSACIASPQTLSACAAPSGVSNYVFYNGSTSYSPQSSWNGSVWSLGNSTSVGTTPSTLTTPTTTPAVGTCQWSCITGKIWNGSLCITDGPKITPATCASCKTVILIQVTTSHPIGGADSFASYNAICSYYGYVAPKHNDLSQPSWSNGTTYWSNAYNPTGPWMNGILIDNWPGGTVWMPGGTSGTDTMLSYARYGGRSIGQTFYNAADVTWYSYHPMTGGNWSNISSGTVTSGQYILCGKP